MGGQMMRRDALEQRWHGSSLRRAVNAVVPEPQGLLGPDRRGAAISQRQ